MNGYLMNDPAPNTFHEPISAGQARWYGHVHDACHCLPADTIGWTEIRRYSLEILGQALCVRLDFSLV